jgi:hypothetical protein
MYQYARAPHMLKKRNPQPCARMCSLDQPWNISHHHRLMSYFYHA